MFFGVAVLGFGGVFLDTDPFPFFRTASVIDESEVALDVDLPEPSSFREDPSGDMPVSGNIHRPEFDSFWDNTLQPDSWAASVRKDGYKLPFKKTPVPYEERNNKTAREDLPYVREAVHKLLSKGSVKRLQCKPSCVNPLSVSSRTVDTKLKKRLCLDLSRHVNPLLRKDCMKMTTLSRALLLVDPGDFQATLDLLSAYHHIRIHPEFHTFLGFCVPDDAGNPVYYCYTVLPFGLTTAAQVLARMTKPVCVYLASKGIKFPLYIDDGNVFAASRFLCEQHLRFVLDTFEKAGYVISSAKTDKPADISQVKSYLGFIINTIEMKIYASAEKIASTHLTLRDVLDSTATSFPVRQIASVIGKVISLEIAFGPVVQLLSRCAQRDFIFSS